MEKSVAKEVFVPSRKYHIEFDMILKSYEVICRDRDTEPIRSKLDKGATKYGAAHRVIDPMHKARS
jgi:hypothetical protein